MSTNNPQNQLPQENQKPPPHDVVVVMIPFPAQGHLNQLLHLSRHLAARASVPVHFVGAAAHNRQAKSRAHWNPNPNPNDTNTLIQFHDILNLPPPSHPNPNTNTSSPQTFPTHLIPSFHATRLLRGAVAELLRRLASEARRLVVVRDSLMAYVAQDAAELPNAESFTFPSVSAFSIFMFCRDFMGGAAVPPNAFVPETVPSLEGCFPAEVFEFLTSQSEFDHLSSGYLYNTSRAIERPYMDALDRIFGGDSKKKNWAIGPLINPIDSSPTGDHRRHKCLEWLDKQASNSVLYVSFGTTTTFGDEQIRELALGLEKSGQKFIWVLREADKVDVFDTEGVREIELPKGFEKRVREVGLVVRDWAPQVEILGHPATGGFLSHCGWNSCAESIAAGVLIGAWPMHSDQPRNAALVTEVLGVGAVVRDLSRRGEVLPAAAVAEGIRRLMAAGSEEGAAMRRRAAELGRAARGSVGEGGESWKEMDGFIAHISR